MRETEEVEKKTQRKVLLKAVFLPNFFKFVIVLLQTIYYNQVIEFTSKRKDLKHNVKHRAYSNP